MKHRLNLTFLHLLLFIAFGFHYAEAQKLMIYRNDHEFHSIPLQEEKELNYLVNSEGKISLTIPSDNANLNTDIENIDSLVVRHADVPTLYIDLPDYPDATTLWDKYNYISATIKVDGCGSTDDLEETSLNVKGRGNSTWNHPKKPIRLKFNKKTSLCGLKKAKSFVLLANYLDQTHMRNVASLWLAREVGVAYANHEVPCNVVVNGNYQGLYLLTEKIGINGASVDIDENTGILFEISSEYDEPYKFKSTRYNLPVMVKDPDFDELYQADPEGLTPTERLALWQEDFNTAEAAVDADKAFDYIDLDSFVDFMLVNNIAKNDELYWPKSVYVSKQSIGDMDKYKFGPIWDHDIAYNLNKPKNGEVVQNSPIGACSMHPFFQKLVSYPEFKVKYKKRFAEFCDNILPALLDHIDQYSYFIEPSAKLDGIKWNEIMVGSWCVRVSSFETKEEVENLKNWIIDRVDYLKTRVDTDVVF